MINYIYHGWSESFDLPGNLAANRQLNKPHCLLTG